MDGEGGNQIPPQGTQQQGENGNSIINNSSQQEHQPQQTEQQQEEKQEGQQEQQEISRSDNLWKTLADKLMDTSAGRLAADVLPDLPWAEIMAEHIKMVMKLIGCIVEEVSTEILHTFVGQANIHPLHAAAASGRAPVGHCCASLLAARFPVTGAVLNAGFHCDVADSYGRSAMHWASTTGQADWVTALVNYGADPDRADLRGMCPLDDAVAAGHVAVASVLLKGGASVNGKRGASWINAPLFEASMFGRLDVVSLLCQAGADLETRARNGFTPLMAAVANKHLDVTEALLDFGSNTETESCMNLTPLMVAAVLGQTEIASALLRGGASACQAGIGSLTPLHIASTKGQTGLVEELLRAGADPKARVAHPPPRSTPLHVACRHSRLSAVVALLRGGADETMQDLTPAPRPQGTYNAMLLAVAPGDGAPEVEDTKPPRPSTTPFDVVGLGRFSPHKDPEQRDGAETAEEHARRRDPETMEFIRRALKRAPADRAWRRRSWLVMLRVSHAAVAAAIRAEVLSTVAERPAIGIGELGRGAAGAGREGGVNSRERKEEEEELEAQRTTPLGGSEGIFGKTAKEGTDAAKRAKREDPADATGSEEASTTTMPIKGAALRAEGSREACAGADNTVGGSSNSRSRSSSSTINSPDNVGSVVGASEGVVAVEGGGGRGGGGSDDDGFRALRSLCGMLFKLADVEEGNFRRIVSFL